MSIYKRGNIYWYSFEYNGKRYRDSTETSDIQLARKVETKCKNALIEGRHDIKKPKAVPSLKDAMKSFLDWADAGNMAKSSADRYRYSSIPLLEFFGGSAPIDEITPEQAERYKAARSKDMKTVRVEPQRLLDGQPISKTEFETLRKSKDAAKRELAKKVVRVELPRVPYVPKDDEDDGTIGPATVNRELACLRAMFNHAIKNKVPVENPINKNGAKLLQEGGRDDEGDVFRVLSFDEEDAYLSKATQTLQDVATTIIEVGMRPEEVYRVMPKNVHLAANYVYNPYGKTKAAKRRITLTAKVRAIFERRMKEAAERAKKNPKAGMFLFPCEIDAARPLPGVQSAHERAVEESGVEYFRVYDCRHTYATRSVEAGVDLVTLAAKLGHSKINMVLRYAHPTQQHQAAATAKVEQYVAAQRIALAEQRAAAVSQAVQ